jgi:HEAT repeat protein
MSTEYAAPDPAVAELVYRSEQESEREHRRLKDTSSDRLKAVVRDHREPEAARGNALLFLLTRRDPEMPTILLELFDDPNQNLWRSVIRAYRPDEPRIKEKLRRFLDDAHEQSWSGAALALARLQDSTILPRLQTWLLAGDRPHRNVAVQCLKAIDVPGAHALLRSGWDHGFADEEDRLVLAAALLDIGDLRGLAGLEAAARAAKGAWSVFAATSIYCHRSRRGLELMLGIIDDGDLEAQQSLVSQVWNFAKLPHAFTADGIHEARAWVESQLNGTAI